MPSLDTLPSPPPEVDPPPIDLLIHGGPVLTMDRDCRQYDDGAVAIRGGELVEVGPAAELMPRWQTQAAEILDATGRLTMPGLVNAHTHLADVLFRGLYDDLALEPWLDRLWASERAFVRPDTVRLGVRLALAEMIRSGTTTALDMFFFPEVSTQVAADTGFRLLAGQPLFSDGAPDGLSWDERLERSRQLADQWRAHPLIETWVMPHATYTVTAAHLAQVRDLVAELEAPFTTHLSETAFEVASVTGRCGHRPPAYLEQLGLLTGRTVLAHLVHLNDGEIELLARHRAVMAHCPMSNLKLGSGIARLGDLQAGGVPITLGTDGPVSSNDLDLWATLRLAAVLHKGAQQDPSLVTAREVALWATRDGAEHLGLGQVTGSLEAGKRADLILIELDRPHLVPRFDLYSLLVYAVGRDDVSHTMVQGRWLMRDRQLATLDETSVRADVAALAADIAAHAARRGG